MEGYLYILTNKSMPELIKIGSTKRSPEQRRRELSRPTGIPMEFEIAYEIFSCNMKELEKWIHLELENVRLSSNREFKNPIFGMSSYNKVSDMENKSTNFTELSEKLLQGIRKALHKLVETSAANGESLVIGDRDGKIKTIPAKDLLESLPK